MAVKIITQYIENYDLDSVSPEGYWKFKGGNEYFVTGHDDRPANAVANLSRTLSSSPYNVEYVIEWEIVPDSVARAAKMIEEEV
jgi:hypothetical protein|tara:strand:+ start:2805 stop:3056 length:252 start_codon:yes stop_codon:yes gene_type:complete